MENTKTDKAEELAGMFRRAVVNMHAASLVAIDAARKATSLTPEDRATLASIYKYWDAVNETYWTPIEAEVLGEMPR